MAAGRDAILSWLASRPGQGALLSELHRRPSVIDAVLRLVRSSGTPSSRRDRSGLDASAWSPSKRADANMRALRTFRRLSGSAAVATPEDHEALLGYSGWGGIDPKNLKETEGIPPEVNDAIREWHAAAAEGRVPATNFFRGVLDQFFTPLPVCRAMWALALRAVPGRSFRYGLEPSAGIGRFLQATPDAISGVHWTLVERDPFLAAFADVLWTDAGVSNELFEAFVARALQDQGRYDLILANPPYGRWGKVGQRHDPGMVPYANDAQTYFLKRSLDLLAPGGVLSVISTAGQLVGTSEENANLRRFLLADAHLSSAALVGVDLFNKLGAAPAAGLAISTWVRLPTGTRERVGYDARDHAILAGKFFASTEDGRASVLGTWGTSRFGDPVVVGPFDEIATGRIPVTPLPAGVSLPEEILSPEGKKAGKPVKSAETSADERSEGPGIEAGPIRDAAEERPSLEMRLGRYYGLLEGSADQRALATASRDELLRDVVDHVQAFGNPHGVPGARGESWLERVVTRAGEVHPTITQGPDARDLARPTQRPTTPAEAIRWYSRSAGRCTETDLLREYPTVVLLDVALSDPGIAVEIQGSDPVVYDRPDYLSGDLYRRLDLLNATLSGELDPSLRSRLEEQKAWLLETISPRTIVQIDARPNSGFVPVEAVSDFVNEDLIKSEPRTKVEIWHEEARYRCRTNGALHLPGTEVGTYLSRTEKRGKKDQIEDRKKALLFLLGYLNRENEVADPDEAEGKSYRRYRSDDPEERRQEDVTLETQFALWLAQSDRWRPVVEDGYNRAFRSDRIRDYPPDPLPIARLNPARRPHGHQWVMARRMEDRGCLLANLAVGAGKSTGALASAAWLRQTGKARRILIVMPNPILTTWITETAVALPDYRVGTIGLTHDARRNLYRPDVGRDAERVAKWRRFAAGGYDVLLCTRSAFLRDVAVDPETMRTVLGRVEWMQRGLGKDAESRRLLQRRIAEAEDEIKKRRVQIGQTGIEAEKARLRAKIQVLEAQIESWRKDAKEPSKTVLAKLQEMIEGNIEAGVFRPSGPDGQPVQGLVSWDELGVDLLVVDEAHGYKNLYAPGGRYGAESIAYMGSKRWSDDWTDFTVTAWDLYLKTSALLTRTGGRGVLLLTATPVKNSPLEVYNVFSYLSDRIWTAREISSGEEWIDRYLNLQPKTYPTADGGLRTDLAVTGFNEVNLEELHDVFRIWMYRLTTKDLVSQGLLPPDAVPDGVEVPADVTMDATQQRLYARLKRLVTVEETIAEAAETRVPGAIRLLRLDMASKIALDPRILREDVQRVAKILVMDQWGKNGGKGSPPDVIVTYPLPEFEEQEKEQEIVSLLRAERVVIEASIDGAATVGRARAPKEKKRGLNDIQRENLERRYLILLSLSLEDVWYDEAEGVLPPKYLELASYVRGTRDCGHLIFSDYNETHAWIRDALVHVAGVRPERIAFLTGSVSADDRDAIATRFNGAKRQFHPITGAAMPHPLTGEAMHADLLPEIDVLIGNSVMSEGLNLQTRTCAIHHASMPWEPATLQQRNGRGVRQGNTLDSVAIRIYVSRASMDMKRKDTILGKATWQESLLSGATAGSIELDTDWAEAMIGEFAETPQQAAELIAKAKKEQEARTKDRLEREVARDFRAAVSIWDRARKAPTAVDRNAQLGIGDRLALPLRSKFQRLGLPEEALLLARERPVWLVPRTGLWLVEGEAVALRSDDPADGAYHETPLRLRVEGVSPTWTNVTVRSWGRPDDARLFLPEGVAPAMLLEPHVYRSIHLKGRIERVGPVPWDTETEWASVREAMIKQNATSLSERPDTGATASPAFRTAARSRDVWRAGLEPLIAGRGGASWLGVVWRAPGGAVRGIPVTKDGTVVVLDAVTVANAVSSGRVSGMPAFWRELLSWRPLASVDAEDAATYARAVRAKDVLALVPPVVGWGASPPAGRTLGPFGLAPMDRKAAEGVYSAWFGYGRRLLSVATARTA